MKSLSIFLPLTCLLLTVSCQQQETPKQDKATPTETPVAIPQKEIPSITRSMVSINATNQGYSMIQPWSKDTPSYSLGYAIYLGDGNFLTSANIIYSGSFVEITTPDGSRTVPVTVTAFDPEANLALLRLKYDKDSSFLDGMIPVELGDAPKLNDTVRFWQFNSDGLPITTEGKLLATESANPFTNGDPFILYNIKSSVTPLQGGAGNPIMNEEGKLIGLSCFITPESQKVQAITQTMLDHYLKQVKTGNYIGFPADGIEIADLNDPVFRKYLGLSEEGGGIYLSKVPENCSFYSAGLRTGDVVESINGHAIDNKGLIKDPSLGPISFNYFLRDTAAPGDVVKVEVRRKQADGSSKPMTFDVTLDRQFMDKDIINPTPFIEPRYRIYGGLVFIPLSGALIDELSKITKNQLPTELLNAIKHKDEFRKNGVDEIIVYLTAMPTPATLGYAQLAPSIVEKIDGVPVKGLSHLNELLDKPSPKGIKNISISMHPYTMYISQDAAGKADNLIKKRITPVLSKD